jgi:hypothetical protein
MRLSKHGWLLWIALAVGLATAAALTQPPAAQAKTKEPCKLRGDKRYPGDFAPKTEIAQWMAEGAAKAKLPPELPVMAALVESELTNLNAGDADSVGFFQMRTSIWNQGPYESFPEDPELQLQWFVDRALEVRERLLAAGVPPSTFLDPPRYGEWIADVERPGQRYEGRYQLRLDEARTLICG